MKRILTLLALVGAVGLPTACSSSGGGGSAARLSTIIRYTNPTATDYTVTRSDAFPKRIDSIFLSHIGDGGPVNYVFDDPSGAVQTSPASGTLLPSETVEIVIEARGVSYAVALLAMRCTYESSSPDVFQVKFPLVFNGGRLDPPLFEIVEVTPPEKFRHLLTPATTFPKTLDAMRVKLEATAKEPVRFELRDLRGDLVGVPATGQIKPGEFADIDIQATRSDFGITVIALSVVYDVVANADSLRKSWTFTNASPPTMEALRALTVLTDNDPLLPKDFWPGLVVSPNGVVVQHPLGGMWSKVPELQFAEIGVVGELGIALTQSQLQRSFWTDKNTKPGTPVNFPPGSGPNGLTVHPNKEVAMQQGGFFVFHMTVEETVPVIDSSTNRYIYGCLLDSDLLSANDWGGTSGLTHDFYLGTDRWYQLQYDKIARWSLTVIQVDAQQGLSEVASAARAIIRDNAILLLIPASEFPVSRPRFRTVAFVHEGDFGISPPHVWSGDVMPPALDPLLQVR